MAGPPTLHAQVVQVRPLADLSLPTSISIKDGTIHVRQKIGMKFGARLTVTFNDRLDLLTSVTYSPGFAMLHGAGRRIEVSGGSHTLGGTTGARYWLIRPGQDLSWELNTGLGVVFGGQPAYEDLFESSTVSAVLGTALRYQIGQIVSLYLRIQERLYRVHFGSGDAGSSKPLRVTLAMGFPFLEAGGR